MDDEQRAVVERHVDEAVRAGARVLAGGRRLPGDGAFYPPTVLDGCTAQAVFLPANCPFSYPTNDRLASEIDWSITEYPTAVITPEDGGWRLAPLQGSALIETQLLDFFSGAVRDVSEPVPFEFDAGLTVTEDAVTVTPVVNY